GSKFNYLTYFRRRALRILPLYYCVIAVALLLPRAGSFWAGELGAPHDLKSFLYHVTFFGLYDQRYMPNAIGVEWTIYIECTFYLLLPFWLWSVADKKRWIVGAAVTVLAYLALQKAPNLLPDPWKP